MKKAVVTRQRDATRRLDHRSNMMKNETEILLSEERGDGQEEEEKVTDVTNRAKRKINSIDAM